MKSLFVYNNSTFAFLAIVALAACGSDEVTRADASASQQSNDGSRIDSPAASSLGDGPTGDRTAAVDGAPSPNPDSAVRVADGGPSADGGAGVDTGPAFSCLPGPGMQRPGPTSTSLEIADSRAGFSGTQGQCGWHYGYVAPATSPAFVAMTEWDPALSTWFVQAGAFWTQLQVDVAHPQGITTTAGRTPVNHFVVRRWRSDVTSIVKITGQIKKHPLGAGGNGVDVRVVVGGTPIYSTLLAGTDQVGRSFSLDAAISVGTDIDFIVEPHESDDTMDATIFEAQVWR